MWFVHQTDLSEHCKRRVMPSIFLGSQVMESSSHVIHFSLLEVPYSCFLSVRAESGYNIILVIELLSENTLVEECANNRDQFIVYELGETFGGYWGPHSNAMMKSQIKNYTKYYTLKTTPSTNTERSHEYEDVTQKALKQTFSEPTDKEPDYIRMEVPLVNVSGNLQLGGPLRHTYNAEEIFDFIYDVTPRNGVEYETSIMPLVQFSIRPQKNDGYYDGTQRYELDYNVGGLTEDSRIKPFQNYKKSQTRLNRLHVNNIESATFSTTDNLKAFNSVDDYNHLKSELFDNKANFNQGKTTTILSLNNKSSTTTVRLIETGTMVNRESWDNIVQAAPVMAVVLNKTEPFFHINKTITAHVEQKSDNNTSKRKKRYIQSLQIENSRPRNLTTKRPMRTDSEPMLRMSEIQDLARLVELQDDEIEGRVALRYLRNYVGAVLFNICDFSEPKSRQTFLFNASRIVISVSNFTLDRMMLVTTPAQSLLNSESRCPSGYLECQVVGTRVCIDSTNACDGVPNCGSYDIYDEDKLLCGASKELQLNVHLAAFTFLAVLLTMIYTVHYWLKRCVPGVSEAFFVYTDASENTLFLDTVMRSPMEVDDASCKLTFSGHYFDDDIIYEDKVANVDGNLCTKILKKCFEVCFCKRKHNDKYSKDIIKEYDAKQSDSKNMLSFTELELRKYAHINSKDEAIQTGGSCDQFNIKEIKNELQYVDALKDSLTKIKTDTYNVDYAKELNILKFAKETRSSSSQSDTISVDQKDFKMDRRHAIIADNEKEIRSTIYDQRSNKTSLTPDSIPFTCEVHLEKHNKTEDLRRLRFEDVPTMIPETENEEDEIVSSSIARRILLTETEEAASSSKDFMRFWGGKSKKNKKKEKHLSMH
ncbi:uncharacterized protein LOC126774781 [Nymphalis io]|uniref:uncharacterized protein LOC126774781 n=1 Tax=Inachis io TaxID=171585 RepID=UPI002167E73E|nr:uncharacterized protein LOC126774781 [Nymphalis io]